MVQGIGPTSGDSGSIAGMVEYQALYEQYQTYKKNNSGSQVSFESWLAMTGKIGWFNKWAENYIESGGQNFTDGDGITGNTIAAGRHVYGNNSAIFQGADEETYYQFDYDTGEYRVLHGNEEIAAALGLPEGTNIDMIEFGAFSAKITDITFGDLDDGQDATNYRVNGNYHGVSITDQEFDVHYVLNALLMDPTDPQYKIAKEVFDKLCANTNQWLPQSDLDMLNEVAAQYGTESAEYKAVLKDVLLSNLDQANEWVEDHTHVAHNQASLEELGSTGATDSSQDTGSSSQAGEEDSGDNVEYDKNTVLAGAGLSGRYNNNEMWHGSWHTKNLDASKNDGINEMTTILNNLVNALSLELGDAYTEEVAAYAQQAMNSVLGGFVITEDEGIIDDEKIKNNNYWAGTDRKGINARKSCAVVSVKGVIDKFFEVFDSLCGNKTEAQKAAEEQAKQEQAAKEEAVFKELYSMDISSIAKDSGLDKDVQVVNASSASEIQAKAESEILQPLMNKIKSQLSGKGVSDADIDTALQQCASYALSYCTEWASTSNNYVYTIDADKLIDKFEEAVKEIVKNKGYAV